MGIIIICISIFFISLLLAVRSLKDLKFGEELKHAVFKKKMKGSIVFFDDKVVHYNNKRK